MNELKPDRDSHTPGAQSALPRRLEQELATLGASLRENELQINEIVSLLVVS